MAQQMGGDHLLDGEDPYGATYCFKGSPFYPPLPLLTGAMCRLCDADVRLGLVACDLVAAVALLAAVRRRGGSLPAALLAAAYLHFPRVPLVMELAWYEPLLAALLGGGLALVAHGHRLGYLFLALGLTGKQYAVVFLPALWRASSGRRLLLVLSIALAGMVVVLPFYLWGPTAFRECVVSYHLDLDVRENGVTLQAMSLNRFNWVLDRSQMACWAALLIGLIAWRTPTRGGSPAPWMAASLLVFCLFFSQAFLNYYYLCEYLLLLGLGEWFVAESS